MSGKKKVKLLQGHVTFKNIHTKKHFFFLISAISCGHFTKGNGVPMSSTINRNSPKISLR